MPDQQIYDLNVAYTGVKNLRLALGVKNLFDKNPPICVPMSNQFQAGYDILRCRTDPRARMIYPGGELQVLGLKYFREGFWPSPIDTNALLASRPQALLI